MKITKWFVLLIIFKTSNYKSHVIKQCHVQYDGITLCASKVKPLKSDLKYI